MDWLINGEWSLGLSARRLDPPRGKPKAPPGIKLSKQHSVSCMASYEGTPIHSLMKKYDTNGDGVFGYDEVYCIVVDMDHHQSLGNLACHFVTLLTVVMVVLVGVVAGVAFAAAEASKELLVGSDVLRSRQGEVIKTAGHLLSFELKDAGGLDLDVVSAAKSVGMLVDMRSEPVGKWVEAAFWVASAVKPSLGEVLINTIAGNTIKVDSGTESGSVSAGLYIDTLS